METCDGIKFEFILRWTRQRCDQKSCSVANFSKAKSKFVFSCRFVAPFYIKCKEKITVIKGACKTKLVGSAFLWSFFYDFDFVLTCAVTGFHMSIMELKFYAANRNYKVFLYLVRCKYYKLILCNEPLWPCESFTNKNKIAHRFLWNAWNNHKLNKQHELQKRKWGVFRGKM